MSAVEEEARAMLPLVAWVDETDTYEEGHVGIEEGGGKQLASPLDSTLGILMQASAFALEKYHCPVLYTVFTNNTHIVAIRTTGNVYAYEVGSRELCPLPAL